MTLRKKATAAIVAILVVASLGVGYYSGSLTKGAETSSTQTITFPSESSASLSITPINLTKPPSTGIPTDEDTYIRACNCSIDLSQKVWPEYATMHDLASASIDVVVGQVTAAQTTGVDDSFEFGGPGSVPLVPVTDYNVSITAMVLDGDYVDNGYPVEVGYSLIVPQVGGTFDGITMNDTGYPNLTVGTSYVFFLTRTTPIQGVYGGQLITTGGAQGLFYIQGGKVYSLDNLYPQADTWLPVKADGVPLYQFLTDVQLAYEGLLPTSTTSSESTTSTSTTISTSSCSPSPTSNFTSSTESEDYFDVTRQFDSWQWNGTSFQIGGYNVTAASQTSYLFPMVSLVVSNGQTSQEATFVNLGARNGQAWPPDFQRGPIGLFDNNVTADWGFTCDMRVFLGVAVVRDP